MNEIRAAREAVERILDGYSMAEVADFLGVDLRSVQRWWATFRQRGADGLTAAFVRGRLRKLSRTQEKIVSDKLPACRRRTKRQAGSLSLQRLGFAHFDLARRG